MTSAYILLVNPKYDYNVGGAVRAAAIFGGSGVRWTGKRVSKIGRLPREERLSDYRHVGQQWLRGEDPQDEIRLLAKLGIVPVALEVRDAAESLVDFIHPTNAVYVFGPEDSSLGRGVLGECHRFVSIPTYIRSPLNLAAAVNVVLYDRMMKDLNPMMAAEAKLAGIAKALGS